MHVLTLCKTSPHFLPTLDLIRSRLYFPEDRHLRVCTRSLTPSRLSLKGINGFFSQKKIKTSPIVRCDATTNVNIIDVINVLSVIYALYNWYDYSQFCNKIQDQHKKELENKDKK